MTLPTGTTGAHEELELTDDGVRLVSLTFGINLYTSQSFYDRPQQVLDTFDIFQGQCPVDHLSFYATETMKVHKPVNKRVLGMPATWLAPGAARKHYVALELKAAALAQDAPTSKYELWAEDADTQQANIVSMALPWNLGRDQPDQMLALVAQLADAFAFRCGLAGYSFECSRYDKRASETHAWSNSMRHRGVDIVRIPLDARAVGSEGIKGVGWLTLLDAQTQQALGGAQAIRKRLSKAIEMVQCTHGVILKAGDAPALGDVNRGDSLPLYREVYDLLAPRIELAADDSMALQLGKDAISKTEDWFVRLRT